MRPALRHRGQHRPFSTPSALAEALVGLVSGRFGVGLGWVEGRFRLGLRLAWGLIRVCLELVLGASGMFSAGLRWLWLV